MKNSTEKISNNSFFEIADSLLKKKQSFFCSRLPGSKKLSLSSGTITQINRSEIKGSKITGLDISEKMLDVGRQKVTERSLENKVSLVSGDAENLSFSKNTFDLISIGFGVRNFQNLEKGLLESFRVLREGGTLIVLETSVPQNRLVKLFYLLFSRTFIPLVGFLFSKDKKAYKYLQKSAEEFPSGESFSQILKSCGFKNVHIMPLMLGASSIYVAKKH